MHAVGVDRRMHVRGTEPVAVRIAGEEQATLQHLVGEVTDARYEVSRIEGRLFNFGEIVFGLRFSTILPTVTSGRSTPPSLLYRARYQIQTG